jgi:hypothetical protein
MFFPPLMHRLARFFQMVARGQPNVWSGALSRRDACTGDQLNLIVRAMDENRFNSAVLIT